MNCFMSLKSTSDSGQAESSDSGQAGQADASTHVDAMAATAAARVKMTLMFARSSVSDRKPTEVL